ncbi:uncharacterized protein LOC133186594 isoform X2 [Saccostrea echinata]|uniref:uncharacterized protein LOC133186594 isoform X2 n=1 Tax=Saccostrea echinata TaxID=191078 RepID=UPI002A81D460|nr:uncharacterized protein LOC133186594 isoform X2 [Saccostrea echinata]
MPENTESEGQGRIGSGHSRSAMTINKELQANKNRIGSAKYYDIASALMGKGKADLEELFLNAARDGDFDRIETFLLRRSDVIVSIDVKDKRTGNTPLIWAAKRGHTKIVQLLLKHGADITLRNYENQTAVEVASAGIRTILLDSVDRSTESFHRLLLQAAWQGNIKVLRKLLNENKVRDINCQNSEGLTALLLACRDIQLFERLSTQMNRPYNPVECVMELLAHRADVHALDGDDMACLHYVSKSKSGLAVAVMQAILAVGPNIESKDKRLFAPIHCASQTGNVECIEALLEGGTEVNCRGFAGATPLHITAYNDHEKAACSLLKHGADVTLTDDRGLTALDLARGRKIKAVLKEAWTEATQCRPSTSLAPLKTPGREDVRLSTEDGKKKKRGGGEVIFDAMPTNVFANVKSAPSRGKPLSRHLSLREKARLAEESMLQDIENGNFTPGPYLSTPNDNDLSSVSRSTCRDGVRKLGKVRGQRVSPSPIPKARSKERLPSISPDRGLDRDSPTFSRNGKYRRSFDEGKIGLGRGNKPVTYPGPNNRSNRVSPLTVKENTRTSPLTIVDPDFDQCMQINRMQVPSSPTPSTSKNYKHHRRSGSDTIANAGDLAMTCDLYINKDRMGLTNKCPQTPVQGAPLYPTSSTILPPTPTLLNQQTTNAHLECAMTEPQPSDDSKDPSPRSDEDELIKNKEVKMAFAGTIELMRSRSIYKDEFILEESRPRDLSLRSSSSEDSHISKRSLSSRSSSGEPPIKENSGKTYKPVMNTNQKNYIKQPLSAATQKNATKQPISTAATQKSATRQPVSSGAIQKSATRQPVPGTSTARVETQPPISKPSSVGSNKLTLRSKQKSVTSESRGAIYLGNLNNETDKRDAPGVSNSAGSSKSSSAQSRITVHSRHLNEGLVNSNVQGNNTDSKSGLMQVVSSQLLSNVKDEIRKRNELLQDKAEETTVVSEVKPEEKESGKEALKKLAKSESNVLALKPGEKEASVPRPATQASAKAVKRIGPIPVNKPAVTNNKAFVSSSQNVQSSTPSYLQPTKSSVSRTTNESSAKDVKANNTKPNTDGKNTARSNILKVGPVKNSESNSKPQKKLEVEVKSTTENSSSASVDNSGKTVNGNNPTSNNSGNISVPKVGTNNAKSFGPKSGKPVSTPSTAQNNATSSNQSLPNSARTQNPQKSTAAGKPLRGNSGATILARAPASSARSESNVPGNKPPQLKEKDANTQKPNQGSSNQTQKINVKSTSVANVEARENVPSSGNTAQSESDLPKVESQKVEEPPAFPYKPASAGKPPLVEIVTSVTPRRAKPEPVVAGPMQTPVIEDPFADLYVDNSVKAPEKKQNGKGVTATAFGYMVSKPGVERSKTNISIKSNKSSKKKDAKPSSANPKIGRRRGGAKSKDKRNTEDAVARPKSGKRIKSGRRRKKIPVDTLLGKQASQSDIALISGIGWHVAASCIDKSDVVAVKFTDSHSSASSESEHEDMEEENFEPNFNRQESFVFDNLELIKSGNFNLDEDTPRFVKEHSKPKHLRNSLSVDVYQQIDNSPGTPSPRFKQIKPDFEAKMNLPRVDNDGYRPMNLDLTQTSLPIQSHKIGENDLNSLPPNFNMFYNMEQMNAAQQELDDILYSNPAVDVANEELNRQILIDKLTPIPESPSLSARTPIHKTLNALKEFDEKVKDDTLNDLLGLNGQTPRVPSEVECAPSQLKRGKFETEIQNLQNRNSSSSGKSKTSERTNSSSQKSSAGSNSRTPGSSAGKKSLQTSAGSRVKGPEPVTRKSQSLQSSAGSKTSRTPVTPLAKRNKNLSKSLNENTRSEIEISIENLKTAIQQNKLKNDEKRNKKDTEHLNVPPPAENVPLLDLKSVHPAEEDNVPSDVRSSQRKKKESGGRSTRRERKFSETKSEEREDTNLDEVVEEILSNTMSSVRSNRTLTNTSRNSTLTEVDRDLLKKMMQNESPFHAKLSASVCDPQRNNQEDEIEDISSQQPYLKVTDDLQTVQKQKVDNEAIAKIMNSFKHMELFAGKGGSLRALKGSREHLHRPHMSVGEPSSAAVNHKPPLSVPKGKSAGKFTEIRGSKQDGGSMKNNSVKETPFKFSNLPPQEGAGIGDDDESLDLSNKTITSDISSTTMDSDSRAGSACTSISNQSNVDDMIQWKKGNVLGKGAFGTVWCGLTSEGQLIAVKQIELNTVDKDKAKREYEKVQEEVELLKLLNHKNIVGYLGTSLEEEESVVSLFMQFVPGGSIASILARFGALDEAVFRRYTKQILEGVSYLHQNDVIHRDIKGGNVMLMPNGIIKLIDFGCAKRLCINLSMGQSQILKSMKGTPYWMAPEVVNETGHGKKSDIWSVGCTIFEMATRKPPWADMNPMAAIFAIGSDRKSPPRLPEKFSAEAMEFVDFCLTRDQSKRPSAAQLLLHSFITKRKNSKGEKK